MKYKIAIITVEAPWGRKETFITSEMLAMKEEDLLIIPRNPTKEVFHKEAQSLLDNAIWLPLISPHMIGAFLLSLLTSSHLWKIMGVIFRHSRTWRILLKNLVVMPKAVFITRLLIEKNIKHIHAHWGSTTATMAYVTSQLTGIPWSFTLHRWDITENNMLKEKVKSAEFARCISETGRRETLQIVGREFADKIDLIHMGVNVPYLSTVPFSNSMGERNFFTVACPANLIEVKGHQFLINACFLLARKGVTNFQCLLFGGGPLRRRIRDKIHELGLQEHVKMPGSVPHEKLMEMYKNGKVDIVILPSIHTSQGDKEGIPVALMEAMAYRIPVISTNTGGIPELLSDDAGFMVEEKNAKQLADAIESLVTDSRLASEIGQKGYERVKEQFNVHKNVARLLELMKKT